MFDSDIEKTIIGTGVALWFAHGWYLNTRLLSVHKKLDLLLSEFNGLRQYLYEIDPQFDDERQTRDAFENSDSMFAGYDDMDLVRTKRAEGRRTLNSPFSE